jgi:hypothetical protein
MRRALEIVKRGWQRHPLLSDKSATPKRLIHWALKPLPFPMNRMTTNKHCSRSIYPVRYMVVLIPR